MKKIASLLLIICSLALAFPRSSPAEEPALPPVALVDLKDADAATRLALVCLQGIVNRGAERPLLYCVHTDRDRTWFEQVYALRGFKAEAVTPAAALTRFADRSKGQVIYDPEQPETINLATALAGLEEALPVTGSTRKEGQRVVEDLRGRFHSRREACQWALDKLVSRCNPRKVAIIPPEQAALRDYLVAEKILPVGLDPKQAEEAKLLRTLLDRFPAGTSLFWEGHVASPAATRALFARDPGDTIPSLARAGGKLLLPGANVANLSFHSRVPAFAPLRQPKHLVQHFPVKYITFLFSGEGNLDFNLGRMRELWDDGARGCVPLGWEIHPALAELAPALLSSYYADSWWGGQDQFVMAPSGYGYLAPAEEKALGEFLNATGKAARDADLTALSVIDLSAPEAAKPWPQFLRPPGVRGLLAVGASVLPTRIAGRPLIGETVRVTDAEKAVPAIADAAAKQKFVLAVVDAGTVTPTQVAGIISRLGPGYRVVQPLELLDLIAERDALEHLEPVLAAPAKLQRVTFTPSKPGPEDPITVKATISGMVVDARVIYTLNDSAEFTEPLVLEEGEYRAVLPPALRSGELKFRVRLADIFLRTLWSGYCTLPLAAKDSDTDGLSDALEKIYGLDPARADTDGDGLLDGNDPAPFAVFPRAKEQEGPTITAIATLPHTPPAAGKTGTIQALAFDPAGVQAIAVSLTADGRDLGGGEMKQVRTTQVYQYTLPALTAGQTLTAVLSATNGAGKSSQARITLPVTLGVRIASPLNNYVAKKAAIIRLEVNGKPAYIRMLVNGYEVAKLTSEPYRYVWDPFQYQPGTHEIVAEAYDADNRLIDFDLIQVRVMGKERR